MTKQESQVEQLTREVIRSKLAALWAEEAELTRQRVAMHQAGKGWTGDDEVAARLLRESVPGTTREAGNELQRMTKQLLNGAGHLVPEPPPGTATDFELAKKRVAVRNAIQLLMSAEAALVDAADMEWARAHAAEYRSIVKGLVLAAAAVQGFSERANAFVDRAGGVSAPEFPLANLVCGVWVGVFSADLATLTRAAVAEGVVSKSELEKAGNGR